MNGAQYGSRNETGRSKWSKDDGVGDLDIPYLRELVVFLAAGGLIVPVFHRLRISPVLGYLFIGALIGPYGVVLLIDDIGWLRYAVIADIEGVRHLAEFGVIFLLFMIGLELSPERLWSMRRLVFGLGSLQVAVTGVIIGVVAWSFGNSPYAAIVLGACLALSSTAIVMQLLTEHRQLGTPLGRACLSVLLLQDLAVVPILFIVGMFGAKLEDGVGPALLEALVRAVAVIAAIFLIGRWGLRPLFRMVSRTHSRETFMAATLLVVIGAAALTGAAGLSMALGAFIAGLLLAETEFRHEIEVDIEPFKGLLLGLFFVSVGMGTDYRILAHDPAWLLASVAGMFVIKAAIVFILGRLFGLPTDAAIEAGLLLGQGGEFAFVVVGLALSLGVLEEPVGQFMLVATGLSMMATPVVAFGARRISAAWRHRNAMAADDTELANLDGMEDHIIIVGFGRIGHTLAALCEAEGLPYVALDLDPRNVADGQRDQRLVYFGDATRAAMLRRVHLDTARALVVTIGNDKAAEKVVRLARAGLAELPIYARARTVSHASRLLGLGATDAVPETVEMSLQLGGRILLGCGLSAEVAARRLDMQRSVELEGIQN